MTSILNNEPTIAGRRCVVIGGGGFIGTNLCQHLLKEGAEVHVIEPSIEASENMKDVKWHQASLGDIGTFKHVIQSNDIIFHLVSTSLPATSNEDPSGDISSNLLPTLKLLELCRDVQVAKIVFLSSGGTVYGPNVVVPTTEEAPTDPICSYGIHKLAIEKYLGLFRHLYGLDSVTLRVANPYGPFQMRDGQGVIATIIKRAILAQQIQIWGDGSVVRDYIHIDDLTNAIVQAALLIDSAAPRIFNIGSGIGHSLLDILKAVEQVHNSPLNVENLPNRSVDIPSSILDIGNALKHLYWQPKVEWEEGISGAYRWMHKHLGAT